MLPPFTRTLAGSFNTVYIDPAGPYRGKPTQIFPIGGLTADGVWVPWQFNADGTPVVAGAQAGKPFHDAAQVESTPGEQQIMCMQEIPVGVVRSLVSVLLVTRVTGMFEVISDGQVIGSGRTGPGGTGPMTWNPSRPLAAGQWYGVLFTARAGSPPQSVEVYVQAVDQQIS